MALSVLSLYSLISTNTQMLRICLVLRGEFAFNDFQAFSNCRSRVDVVQVVRSGFGVFNSGWLCRERGQSSLGEHWGDVVGLKSKSATLNSSVEDLFGSR